MNATHPNPTEQAALWNGRAGRAWIDGQATLDQMFKPFEDMLADTVRTTSARRVLDVGCGTGSTTLAAARTAGAQGDCLGVDISKPMVAVARARAGQQGSTARFIAADVQTHAFAPASFDLVISRFGVMFFNDPMAAFANLRRASSAGARLQAIAWRSAAENPYMTTAERAAAPLLPNLPVRPPGAPGQFGFADRHRVASILQESGWGEIDIQPIDVACAYPEKDLVGYFTRLGTVGQVLEDMDEATRRQVIDTLRTAFDPFVHGDEVRFTAACWLIAATATAPPAPASAS